ncbi:MAG: MaoC family dehydratase [Gemmatimonadota bacterium]|nr:MaoC family dehydratase [Gemmatimonadota bacterium]
MSIDDVRAQLEAQIGQEAPASDWVQVDQKRIDQFAEATGDHQWIHVDVDRSKRESPYGAPIAHGYLTLSLLPMLASLGPDEQPRYPGVKLSVNYGLNRVRFPAAVRSGARVRARTILKEVTEVPGALQLVRVVTIDIEGEEKPACVAESVSRLYFE